MPTFHFHTGPAKNKCTSGGDMLWQDVSLQTICLDCMGGSSNGKSDTATRAKWLCAVKPRRAVAFVAIAAQNELNSAVGTTAQCLCPMYHWTV